MDSKDKMNQKDSSRKSQDPRERLQQNPSMKSGEVDKNVSHDDKNDLLNEDPEEEKREIEKDSEDKLNSAE